MDSTFQDTIRRATALTRQGDLTEATQLLRQGLGIDAPGPTSGERETQRRLPPPHTASDGASSKRAARGETASKPARPKTATPKPVSPKPASKAWRRTYPKLHVKPLGSREPPVAPGARFEWRALEGPSGGRRYRLYIPSALAADTTGAPLLLMLHGCTQDPDDFALGTRMNVLAEQFGVVVAYPEQTRAANAMGCWNWFQPAHQGRSGGEPAELAAIAQQIIAAQGLDQTRVFVAGLSAGGAMAAVLAETHPDVFAAVGVHSGLPYGSARDVASAQSAMSGGMSNGLASGLSQGLGRGHDRPAHKSAGTRTIVVHGDADRTVHAGNGNAIFAAAHGTHPAQEERSHPPQEERSGRATVQRARGADGRIMAEHWRIAGLGHAWSGGDAGGSYSDPSAPDASLAMLRFFLDAT